MHPYRMCPAGSKRNRGRHGRLHHYLEHGPFYHMLVPRPVKEWVVETKRRVIMIAENGKMNEWMALKIHARSLLLTAS